MLGILCYSNTLHNPFIFDDIPNIVERRGIHLDSLSAAGLVRLKDGLGGNRPVALLSFALNYYFGGLDPFGYHLVNLLIHLLTSVLVYLFLKLTLSLPSLRERYGQYAREIALLSSLLFVAHPIQTQAVTYIVQRMASLAALFFILAIYCYAKARLAEGRKRVALFIGSILAGLLAFGSKETAITLPVFVALYEYYFHQRLKLTPSKKKWSYTIIGLALLIGLLAGMYYTGFKPLHWLNSTYKKYPFTPPQRLLTQLRVVVFYLSLLIAPLPSRLNLDHHFSLSYSLFNPPTTLLCLGLILGLIAGSIYLAKKRPLISFALIWFWGNLALESSFLPIELVYEHRLYLPALGFFILVSIFLVKGIEKLKIKAQLKQQAKLVLLLTLIIPLSAMTYQRNKVWQDRASLWKDAADKSPTLARPHYNLANVYAQREDYDKAMPYYLETIQLKPSHAKAHNNLGYCYFFKGDIQKAIAGSKTALRYKPKLVDAYFNLGIYYWNLKKLGAARDEFQKALKINPQYQKAIDGLRELEKESNKRGSGA